MLYVYFYPKIMSSIKKIFALIVFLCFAQRYEVNAAIKSYKQYHNHPEKQVFYDDYSFKDGYLLYAVCDGTAKEKNCTLMQEQYPDGKLLRSCNVTWEVYEENAKLTDKLYTVAFGRDHAILFWDEIGPTKTYFKLLTVKMDYCDYGGFALEDPAMEIYNELRNNDKIITYDDTFEIFINNNYLPNADNDTERLMIVNSSDFVDHPSIIFLKSGKYSVRHISPIDIKSSNNKSYVYSKEWLEEYELAILKPDGFEKVLATKNNKFNIYTSLVNDEISLCEREGLDSIVSCTQYDKEGNAKFNVTFGNSKEKIAPRNMYNLPGGGFLIAFSEYDKSSDETDYSMVTDYFIIKVNGEGRRVGSIHLKDLVHADNMIKVLVDVRIWKNGDEDYCVAVIGQGVNQTNVDDKLSDLSVVVNCFTDADLAA